MDPYRPRESHGPQDKGKRKANESWVYRKTRNTGAINSDGKTGRVPGR